MDVAPQRNERPEDVLHALATNEDNLGARMLRMAQTAAAYHRATILDLLCDDSAPAADAPTTAPHAGAGFPVEAPAALPAVAHEPPDASLALGERNDGAAPECDIMVLAAPSRKGVA